MTTGQLPPVDSRQWRQQARSGVSLARVLLGILLAVTTAGAGCQAYVAATRVRPERQAEYVVLFVVYPALQGALVALALWWLYKERTAGRYLAAGILVYAAARAAWLSWSGGGEGYANGIERSAGRLVQAGAAVLLFLPVPRLVREARRSGEA